MSLATGVVEAASISDAWLGAAGRLAEMPGHTAVHLVVRIADPLAEDPAVRSELDRVLLARSKQSTSTVANTLFPAALAERYREPAELAEHYRTDVLPRLCRLARPKNAKGTYFGRLVAYPEGGGNFTDQLTATVDKLRREEALPSPLSSCYELAVHSPGQDDDPAADSDSAATRDVTANQDAGADAAVLTYNGHRDSSARMGFPCLSLVSFHLDGPELHLAAHYRNQHFFERAYGNYLGLGRLLGYVATAAGLKPGELLVIAGHARLETVARLRALLGGHDWLPLDLKGAP